MDSGKAALLLTLESYCKYTSKSEFALLNDKYKETYEKKSVKQVLKAVEQMFLGCVLAMTHNKEIEDFLEERTVELLFAVHADLKAVSLHLSGSVESS